MQVTVFNTVGSNESTVEFTGNTWGQLQSVLDDNNIVYKGMSAILGESQLTLESAQATTPVEDFILFLLPVEVKSGNNDDLDFTDDDFNDDNDDFLPSVSVVISPENQMLINKLNQANALNNEVIQVLSGRQITDPKTLSLIAKAAQLAANKRS